MKKIQVLGVGITSAKKEEILEYVVQKLQKGQEKCFIVTPNPEFLVSAARHPEFKAILNKADVALADGVGLLASAWLLGNPLKERFAGVDFIEKLCVASREKPMSMGFLGGGPGIAKKAAECLKKKYPWITIGWVGEEWNASEFRRGPVGSYPHPTSSLTSFTAGARRGPPTPTTPWLDMLFVAFGAPKQEKWIYENLEKIPATAAMGVGGAFDYLSGEVMRAPKFVRAMGLEWLFRLIRQPWRWKRQLALLEFIQLVLKEKLSKKNN